jgi:hypothetical protein
MKRLNEMVREATGRMSDGFKLIVAGLQQAVANVDKHEQLGITTVEGAMDGSW